MRANDASTRSVSSARGMVRTGRAVQTTTAEDMRTRRDLMDDSMMRGMHRVGSALGMHRVGSALGSPSAAAGAGTCPVLPPFMRRARSSRACCGSRTIPRSGLREAYSSSRL